MEQDQSCDILLAEDTDSDAEITLRAMQRAGCGGRVVRVQDGEEALDFLYHRGRYAHSAHQRPKIILLDVKMPKVNGIEVLRQLKSNPYTKTIPVVMLTSSAEECDTLESYQWGANGYVVKPVEFDQFIEAVSKLADYWGRINEPPPTG